MATQITVREKPDKQSRTKAPKKDTQKTMVTVFLAVTGVMQITAIIQEAQHRSPKRDPDKH